MSELFGAHISGVHEQNPFGGLPFSLAGREASQIQPLLRYFGFGAPAGSARAGRQESRLSAATGPLADVIRGVRGIEPGVLPEAQRVGEQVSSIGSEAFTSLQGQIQNLLSTLPESQAQASQFARTAFDPVSETPFFNEATRRAVQPIRGEFAARGLGDSGAALGAETEARGRLSEDFAQEQLGLQSTAPLLAPQVAEVGVGAAGNLLQAVPQLAQALTSRFGIPLEAAGGLIQLLTGAQGPGMQLLGQTAPQFTPYSGKQSFFGPGISG